MIGSFQKVITEEKTRSSFIGWSAREL